MLRPWDVGNSLPCGKPTVVERLPAFSACLYLNAANSKLRWGLARLGAGWFGPGGGGIKKECHPPKKARCGFGLERIKIRKNTLKPPWTPSQPRQMMHATADCGRPHGHCVLAAGPWPREV